jgi:hypothetical protein
MKRRTLLQMAAAALAWMRMPAHLPGAQAAALTPADEGRMRALAEVVLPGELARDRRSEIVDEFLRWIRNYREGAEMDHGYGFTRLRRTPPPPAARYPAQLAALDRAARAKGAAFESTDTAARRAIVEAAIVAAKVERLPARPTGDHVATDLMAFYFHGPSASDLAYRAAIARDACRGLPGSDRRPDRV